MAKTPKSITVKLDTTVSPFVEGAREFTVRAVCNYPAPLATNGGGFAGCTRDEGHEGDHELLIRWAR